MKEMEALTMAESEKKTRLQTAIQFNFVMASVVIYQIFSYFFSFLMCEKVFYVFCYNNKKFSFFNFFFCCFKWCFKGLLNLNNKCSYYFQTAIFSTSAMKYN